MHMGAAGVAALLVICDLLYGHSSPFNTLTGLNCQQIDCDTLAVCIIQWGSFPSDTNQYVVPAGYSGMPKGA